MSETKPKIFISHAWEDNEISRKLAENLKRDGAEIWIDYAKIRGGDSLPEIISNAIEWCDTLILVWSKKASNSYWVKEEWTCAHSIRKRIVPCLVDEAELPSILRSRLYIDIRIFEVGYKGLTQAINVVIKQEQQESKTIKVTKVKENVKVLKSDKSKMGYLKKNKQVFNQESEVISKKKVRPIKEIESETKKRRKWYVIAWSINIVVCLIIVGYLAITYLNAYLNYLNSPGISEIDLKAMFKENDFFDREINPNGKGVDNQFEERLIDCEKVVVDKKTALMWQQGGSDNYMDYGDTEKWIKELNENRFAGFNDWRLPTLKEAMSLMESEKKKGDFYIDPLFEREQRWIWTSDLVKGTFSSTWIVVFEQGRCTAEHPYAVGYPCVRAVRSVQSSEE